MALDPATCTGGVNTAINETCAAFKYWTQDQETFLGGKLEDIKTKLDALHTDLVTIDTDLNSTTNVKLDTLHDDLLDVQTAISGISGGGGGSVDVTGVESRLDTSNDIQQAIGEAINSYGNLYMVLFGVFMFFALLWYILKKFLYV